MYIGSAGLMTPLIARSRQNQNHILGTCALGAGAILSIGMGKVASKLWHNIVDKVVDFWDDVKPEDDKEEAKDNG